MASWRYFEFPETIRRTTVGRENQILSADIQATGRFPVVDQGQAFISGYSDAVERVIGDDLPLVIFGDHTRCLKFVDFPFILGADGTPPPPPPTPPPPHPPLRSLKALMISAGEC